MNESAQTGTCEPDVANCRALQSAVANPNVGVIAMKLRVLGFAAVIGIQLLCGGCDSSSKTELRFQVASSSMAPQWFGSHRPAECEVCGRRWKIPSETFDDKIPASCARCGNVAHVSLNAEPGDVVTARTEFSAIQRFDVIAFQSKEGDESSASTQLKRVWALPSERIELRGGEAWIDGEMLRKSTQQFADLAIPLPSSTISQPSGWSLRSTADPPVAIGQTTEPVSTLTLQPTQQLEFTYRRPVRGPDRVALEASPLDDDYPCNQNSTATLHRVDDYLVGIELAQPMIAVWRTELQVGDRRVDIGFAEVSYADDQVVAIDFETRFLVGVCDGYVIVCTPRREWRFKPDELPAARVQPDSSDVSSAIPLVTIQASQSMEFKRIVVARDFWLGPRENRATEWSEASTANADGYFVMGDNLPISLDSRDEKIGRVPTSAIVGRVPNVHQRDWILDFLDRCSAQ